jgi:hypothetical protein
MLVTLAPKPPDKLRRGTGTCTAHLHGPASAMHKLFIALLQGLLSCAVVPVPFVSGCLAVQFHSVQIRSSGVAFGRNK